MSITLIMVKFSINVIMVLEIFHALIDVHVTIRSTRDVKIIYSHLT